MHEIGIDICFSAAEVRWDNASIPMQPVDKSTEEFEQELFFAQDPITTNAERIQNIVKSKYCPADLNKIATECNLLNADLQKTLHKLLRTFVHLFDGTLGNWKTDSVDLELKDKNEKPYHTRPYPVPHSQEQLLVTLVILSFVIEIYNALFSLFNLFSICSVLNVKDHISSKHKLSWSTLKTCMKGRSDCKSSYT
jgi:hypothetical protein